MKNRITSAFVSALCLISAVSCGQIGYDTVSDIPETGAETTTETTETTDTTDAADTTETASDEPTIKEEDEQAKSAIEISDCIPNIENEKLQYVGELPELSDEIPPEAVVKATIYTHYIDEDKGSPFMIFYNDKYNNHLLTLTFDENGECEVYSNSCYEYNSNGDVTFSSNRRADNYTRYFYEYDADNNQTQIITNNATRNPDTGSDETENLTMVVGHEYDSNGNTIGDSVASYNDISGKNDFGINDFTQTEYRDCVYDSDNRLISYREFNISLLYDPNDSASPHYTESEGNKHELAYDADGNIILDTEYDINDEWESTVELSYDSEGRLLFKKCTSSDHSPNQETHEYDPRCGKETKFLREELNDDDSVKKYDLVESEYDSEGRLIKQFTSAEDNPRKYVDEYEYEKL